MYNSIESPTTTSDWVIRQIKLLSNHNQILETRSQKVHSGSNSKVFKIYVSKLKMLALFYFTAKLFKLTWALNCTLIYMSLKPLICSSTWLQLKTYGTSTSSTGLLRPSKTKRCKSKSEQLYHKSFFKVLLSILRGTSMKNVAEPFGH